MSSSARPIDTTPPASGGDLAARGFKPFIEAHSKGHAFTIWLKPPAVAGRTAWKTAVLSCGTRTFATAYVAEDGMLRACVSIPEPRGYLLFRAETRCGEPVASDGFQCKFGVG